MTDTPHDSLARAVFGQVEHASGLLRSVLPMELAALIDWNELTLLSSSYVDEELRSRHGDLLFQAPFGSQDGYVYVLLEHQSTEDRWLAFRLLRYVVRFLESWLEEHAEARGLPPVVPVVLYHDRSAWKAARSMSELFEVEPEVRPVVEPWLPGLRFLLDDLNEASDQGLRSRALSALGTLALLALKHARFSKDFERRLADSTDLCRQVLAAPGGFQAFARILRYILLVSDQVQPAQLARLMRSEGDDEVGKVVAKMGGSILDQEREAGHAEGRAKGHAEGERQLLLRLLRTRFGDLPAEVLTRVEQATTHQLEDWGEKILSARSLDDVFSSEGPPDQDAQPE